MPSKVKVTALVVGEDGQRQITVTGQKARALLSLIEAGPKGRTAQEVAGWAYRFAAYLHFLRRDHGINTICEREDHSGGWHGRHYLTDRVTIIRVTGGDQQIDGVAA